MALAIVFCQRNKQRKRGKEKEKYENVNDGVSVCRGCGSLGRRVAVCSYEFLKSQGDEQSSDGGETPRLERRQHERQ